jgi:hypothetical protein
MSIGFEFETDDLSAFVKSADTGYKYLPISRDFNHLEL